MCGIVGCTLPGECPPEVFDAMVDSLVHRGPDGRGVYRDEFVALGHRRLAVLDPSPCGAQPMTSHNGNAVITFNGEIYNHLELRQEHLPDVEWRSTSDTETILELYCKYGRNFVEHLNGMFAMAIYDRREKKLFIYRDRFGQKPLFYHSSPKGFLFGSELKALMRHPAFEKDINPSSVAEYVLFNYIPRDRCIFRMTRKLLPGQCLEFDLVRQKANLHRYYNISRMPLPERRIDPEEKTREFFELFEDAVSKRLLSDVPLGCFLSGGLDSSAVAAAMTAQVEGSVDAFSIGFDDPAYDESSDAARTAKHLGARHHLLKVTPQDFLSVVDDLPTICDEPFADASIIPTVVLSSWSRQKVTVALSGDGGDEMLLGYDRYHWADKIAGWSRVVPNGLRLLATDIARFVPHYKLQTIAAGMGFRDEHCLYGSLLIGWNAGNTDRLLTHQNRLRSRFYRHSVNEINRANRELAPAEIGGRTDLAHYLPEDILQKVDRASMAFALETRSPFLDFRLAEFCHRLPTAMKYTRDRQKIILRHYLERKFPRGFFDRPKRGFAVPLKHWFRNELKPMLKDVLAPSELRKHDFLDVKGVEELMRKHFSGRYNYERQLWALLMFQLWHRKYME